MVEFHTNPISSLVEITVVVGSATVLASKLAHHVIALAVPLSVMSILRIFPSIGVPVRFVVKEVTACARPVICATATVSVLIAGVADCVITVATRPHGWKVGADAAPLLVSTVPDAQSVAPA